MKYIKRISLIVVAVLVLACSVPLSSLAVDPVSAATMANAFAQAITAYGASQGVSMTFDVVNTDGIGEGVHDLWNQYQEDMANSSVTVSDYQNLAASAFPTLWIKIGEKIGVNLDAASVGEIDGFWNWLLSGPAEMTKVDNQYYEWSVDQQTGEVNPIQVIGYGLFYNQPLPYDSYVNANEYRKQLFIGTGLVNNVSCDVYCYTDQSNNIYVFQVGTDTYFAVKGTSSRASYYLIDSSDSVLSNGTVQIYSGSPWRSGYISGLLTGYNLPVFSTYQDAITELNNVINGNETVVSSISVQPYVGDEVPQNVYIPDNTDVNYEPIPAAIPTDITWDDALFGDGTGTLTDAQSEAITQTVDQVIADNPAKTLELADPANPPAPSPSEVYIPFLPVTLPSFNFSLSGIWHYVTAWVASLGAWFSLVFTTWSYLPYAISVPVYATAVIVIVLGVYKRFFM